MTLPSISMRLLFIGWLVAAAGCSALDCPRGDSYCDGDIRTTCTTRCNPSNKATPNCATDVSTLDCSTAFLDTLGVRKTCRVVSGDKKTYAVCLNAELNPCTPATGGSSVTIRPLRCLPSGHLLTCATYGAEAFENTEVCDQAGLTCHGSPGPSCVDSPKVPCDPLAYPRCDGDRAQQACLGSPDAGYFLRSRECTAPYACRMQNGQTICDYAPDAGTRDGG